MCSTRKAPEHLKSAKNLRGVAEAAGAAGVEAAGAEAAGAAEVVEAALVAEVLALVAGVSALVAEVAEGVVAEAAGAEGVGAEGVARSERQAARRSRRLVAINVEMRRHLLVTGNPRGCRRCQLRASQ